MPARFEKARRRGFRSWRRPNYRNRFSVSTQPVLNCLTERRPGVTFFASEQKGSRKLAKRFFRVGSTAKDVTVVFRWLVILVSAAFLYFSPEKYSRQKFIVLTGLILVYILTNAVLSFVSNQVFWRYRLNRYILFGDILLISVIIYLIKGFETDLYLVYFLIIFVSAIQGGGFRRSWIIGLVTSALYLGLYLRTHSVESLLSSYILLRIPFFFLISVFSTYLSAHLREETHLRKEAEGKSTDLLQQYKTLVDTIPDIIFEIDPAGKFTFLSEAIRLAGYKPEALLGRHFGEIIHPEDLPRVSRDPALARYKGKPTGDQSAPKLFDERRTGSRMTKSLHTRLLLGPAAQGKDSYIHIEVHSSGKWGTEAATAQPALLGSVGIIRDVTESTLNKKAVEIKNEELRLINQDLEARREELEGILEEVKRSNEELKKAQARLLQSEKLASIGQLAAGIAHEVNNPLGFLGANVAILGGHMESFKSLLGRVQTLREAVDLREEDRISEEAHRIAKWADSLDIPFILEDADRLVKGTMTGVDRIKKIMTELKTFSRKDDGARQPVVLDEIVEGVLGIVWNEIKYKAELKKEYGQVPPVKCNPQQISQVVLNLLLNAVQALEGRGVITVRTFVRDRGACLEVEDTGKGIPPEIRDKIFEPFFTTKEQGKGTGLGLSISSEIVQRHKGSIGVSSSEDRGTIFTVWLPFDVHGGST
jgi:PAS domain S-box-containing protein